MLTTIDTCRNLLEIHPLLTKTSAKVSQTFENGWSSCYLCPLRVVHNQGPEFLGHEFQMLLHHARIQSIPTTACNPQANRIDEAVHRSIGQVLRMLIHLHSPKSQPQAETLVQTACATAMHASHCAVHPSLHIHSPGTIAFRHDVSLDIPLLADILTLQAHHQALVDWCLLQSNTSHVSHDYIVGEQVLKKNVLSLSDKLQPSFVGPFLITQVHMNGTCTIHLSHNVLERINI